MRVIRDSTPAIGTCFKFFKFSGITDLNLKNRIVSAFSIILPWDLLGVHRAIRKFQMSDFQMKSGRWMETELYDLLPYQAITTSLAHDTLQSLIAVRYKLPE